MTTNSAELKPCPLCTSAAKVVRVVGTSFVQCKQWDCACRGPACGTMAEAINGWNRRTAAQGEQSKDDRISALEVALRSINAVAIENGYKFGACDQIDNDGMPYQSQWLADLLKGSSCQAGSAEQVSEREAFEAIYEKTQCKGGGRFGWLKNFAWSIWQARAALSAPERKVTDAELPPLPTPEHDYITKPGFTANQMREYALAALNQQGEQTAPEGFVIVPVEVTDEMTEAAWCAWTSRSKSEDWTSTLKRMHLAMIAAAPSTAQKDGGNNG